MRGKKAKLLRAIARQMTTVFDNKETGLPIYRYYDTVTRYCAPGTYRACIHAVKRLYRKGLLPLLKSSHTTSRMGVQPC